MKPTIKYVVYHQIDLENKSKNIEVQNIYGEGLNIYINEIIKEVLTIENFGQFKIASLTTEIVALVLELCKSDKVIEEKTNRIVERLTKKEKEAQKKIAHLGKNILQGSLIQTKLYDSNNFYYLIAKVEHNGFVDENDQEDHIGLPKEKRTLRTALFILNKEYEIEDIKLYDTHTGIVKYWKVDFLELEPVRTESFNTNKSFAKFDLILKQNLYKQSKEDYWALRNNLITYYRTNESFDYQDFKQKIFSDHIVKGNINIDKIETKFDKVFDKKEFDQKFDISKEELKARLKKKYDINEHMDLFIKDAVDGQPNIIHSFKESNQKYLKIKLENEELYERFKIRK